MWQPVAFGLGMRLLCISAYGLCRSLLNRFLISVIIEWKRANFDTTFTVPSPPALSHLIAYIALKSASPCSLPLYLLLVYAIEISIIFMTFGLARCDSKHSSCAAAATSDICNILLLLDFKPANCMPLKLASKSIRVIMICFRSTFLVATFPVLCKTQEMHHVSSPTTYYFLWNIAYMYVRAYFAAQIFILYFKPP